jgi:hypothetical protein
MVYYYKVYNVRKQNLYLTVIYCRVYSPRYEEENQRLSVHLRALRALMDTARPGERASCVPKVQESLLE